MKKFQFRMKALLKMKEHIEKEKQKILALSQKKVMDQKDTLGETEQKSQNTKQNQTLKFRKPFKVVEMLVYSRFIHKLKRDKLLGEQMLNVLEQDETNKRQELHEAARERKKYAKLKEKQQEHYYAEIDKNIAKEADEIAVNSYRLKKNKG